MDAQVLINNYLSKIEMNKVNATFSSWRETKINLPQGSVLEPLLFNVFINDIFLLNQSSKLCSNADDTSACNMYFNADIRNFESYCAILSKCFKDNF